MSLNKMANPFKRPRFVAGFILMVVLLLTYPVFAGWQYRMARFRAGLRIVQEHNGQFIRESDWIAYADNVRFGGNTDLETASTVLDLLLGGQIGTLDFSDTSLKKSDIEALSIWKMVGADNIRWPVP